MKGKSHAQNFFDERKMKQFDVEFKTYDWTGKGRLTKGEAKNCVLHYAACQKNGVGWEELVVFAHKKMDAHKRETIGL